MRIAVVFSAAWVACLWVGSLAQAPARKAAQSCPSPPVAEELQPPGGYTGVPGTAAERSFFVSFVWAIQREAVVIQT